MTRIHLLFASILITLCATTEDLIRDVMDPPTTANTAVDLLHLLVMGVDVPQYPMAGNLMTMDIVDVAIPDHPTVVHITVADHLTILAVTVVALLHLSTEMADVDGLLAPTGKIYAVALHSLSVVMILFLLSCFL